MAFMPSSPPAEQVGTKEQLHRAAITSRDGCEVGVEIRQLAYFAAVAEELSFARAAQRLHIVRPAVSQRVPAGSNASSGCSCSSARPGGCG